MEAHVATFLKAINLPCFELSNFVPKIWLLALEISVPNWSRFASELGNITFHSIHFILKQRLQLRNHVDKFAVHGILASVVVSYLLTFSVSISCVSIMFICVSSIVPICLPPGRWPPPGRFWRARSGAPIDNSSRARSNVCRRGVPTTPQTRGRNRHRPRPLLGPGARGGK